MPLHRRLPKRGFTNIFKKRYAMVNLGDLAKLDAKEKVTPELLVDRGIVGRLRDGLKVLGEGELKAPLQVAAHHFSESARRKDCKGRWKSGGYLRMMENLKSLTEIPDLRKRILFTLLMLAVYRLGSFIPTPGINPAVLQRALSGLGNTLFGLLSMFSGGSLGRLTVFALGIMPYITASIILQLLGVVSPP